MSRDAQSAQYAQILRNLPPHVAMTTNGVPEEGFGRKDKWEVYDAVRLYRNEFEA
ncbi:hypothetical protein QBC32DRAFT_335398 [Pseudoneurospora amorphoporcata]|uniref:Uncharacterized protein n=1 Tax=Pseudoneurospora amorphoporcata TaxID=241081 RepID=A0AAN6NZ61_9PEZI|nr:hypothetical protein QBC32DRAFT_335398 [Pseudoneurospora amorphoporcata]